jgi:hypothetical protein
MHPVPRTTYPAPRVFFDRTKFQSVLNLSKCTPHPVPCTPCVFQSKKAPIGPKAIQMHPVPCTLHPVPCTPCVFRSNKVSIRPKPFQMHPVPCTPYPAPRVFFNGRKFQSVLNLSKCTLYPVPRALHPVVLWNYLEGVGEFKRIIPSFLRRVSILA